MTRRSNMSNDRQQCSDDWNTLMKEKYGSGVLKKALGVSEDKVNHPKHYTFGKLEVIDVLEDWGLDKDFCLGNTIKYIARARHKGNELEDLKKAQWYLNRKIMKLE